MRNTIRAMADCLAPNLTNEYRRFRDGQRLKDQPVLTKYGFKFVGNKAMQNGTFEPVETEIILSFFKSADLFVNIGANIGYYCCLALHRKIHTIAFEPIPNNVQLLQKNISINGFEVECEIYPIALGNSFEFIKMFGGDTGASAIPGWSGTNERYFSFVPCNKLDNILLHRDFGRALVLMDIEGGELEALKGAKGFLRSNKDITWVVEICIDQHQPVGVKINPNILETFELFWLSGYKSYCADRSLRPVGESCILDILKAELNNLSTHNFIFSKKSLNSIF